MKMKTDKDEQILRKHLLDLAKTAERKGIPIFSDFLNLNEQNIFFSMKQELPHITYIAYGGYEDSERKMLCFCDDFSITSYEDVEFPITCIKIVPLNHKFSDQLNHRDFLGAVLNLGIDRSKIGDIIVKENEGYLFCSTAISYFIIDNLFKIKHTMIQASVLDYRDFDYQPKFKEIKGTVTSIRLDSILAVALKKSRSSLSGLIAGGKVYVNSKEVYSNSYQLKENDVVSVRGYGKFIFQGTSSVTKKGRYSVTILLYT
jgi:RNA-binding protein YlmH